MQEDGEAGAVGAHQTQRRCVLGCGEQAGHGPCRLAPGVGLAGGGARRVEEGRHQDLVLVTAGEGDGGDARGPQHHAVAGDHTESEVVEGGHRLTSLRSGVRP